jgi:hypothetical protein
MDIVIFKEVTTEGIITSIEENSKKYHDGLYADMNNLPERTMVKKGAAEIGDIIKALKTSRIKLTKESTAKINKEHDAIVERLVIANKPFTDLLDAYNVERKVILDAEKARKQAIIDLDIFNRDHEMALLIDKTYAYDQEQALKAQQEHDDKIKRQATIDAEACQKRIADCKAVQDKHEENARLANKEHVRNINNTTMHSLLKECYLTENQAKEIVIALAKNKILNVTINY